MFSSWIPIPIFLPLNTPRHFRSQVLRAMIPTSAAFIPNLSKSGFSSFVLYLSSFFVLECIELRGCAALLHPLSVLFPT